MKQSYILLTLFGVLSVCGFAQIPNASFENWSNTPGYPSPDGWDNLNDSTMSAATYTCAPDSPGTSGQLYLNLVTRNIQGIGMVSGVACLGSLSKTDLKHPHPISPGFAYTNRPTYFSGMWQYMGSGNDVGYIAVLLSKWDSTNHVRDTIAYTYYRLTNMAMVWTPFSLPLTYSNTGNPDSAMIMLSASGLTPAAASFLLVDQVAFTDYNLADGIINISGGNEISAYPNPSHDQLMIKSIYNISFANITDMTGRIVSIGNPIDSNHYILSTADFATGTYLVKILTSSGTYIKKIAVE